MKPDAEPRPRRLPALALGLLAGAGLALLLLLALQQLGLVTLAVLPDRAHRLAVKDGWAQVTSRSRLAGQQVRGLDIPYRDILEDGPGSWRAGTRRVASDRLLVIVIDVHEHIVGRSGYDPVAYASYLQRLNTFLAQMRRQGVVTWHAHHPWEGGQPSSTLVRDAADRWITTQQEEAQAIGALQQYDLVLLVGTAGDKCVLTRPLGAIELARRHIPTVYLHDLMVYFEKPGAGPAYAASDTLLSTVALNWGYVGTGAEILQAQQR